MDAQDKYLAALAQNRTEREQEEILNAGYPGKVATCRHESTLTTDGDGAFCRFCGETIA